MPIESLFPKLDIPDVDIWEFLLERNDKEFPDDTVLYRDATTVRSYTYSEVKNTAVAFGKGLRDCWDWQKGDVLAIFSPNCVDTPSVIWGTQWAGGVLSPANPGYTFEELAFQIKDAGARALITQRSLLDVAKAAADKAGLPYDKIILMGDEKDPDYQFKHFLTIQATSKAEYQRTVLDPKRDLAFLVYSSGTTGYPKGVMLSHYNIVSNLLMLKCGDENNLSWKDGPGRKADKILAFLPFFHIYGLTCMIHYTMYTGITLVVMTKYDLEAWCSLVQSHKITFSYVVPPVVLQLAKHPIVSKYDLSTIRMLNSGAAPLTSEIVETLYRRLKIPVRQGYGLSETSPGTHVQPWEDWNKTIGSVGRLLPNQTAKYMSPDEVEVPVGETGELWIKGPNVFQGYLNNDDGTKNALTKDGYFKTGDVGHQDKDGNFFITDRVKELIKYKGFQVPPAELEGLLLSHPNIDDCAVIGIYNEDEGTEVPKAFVVPAKGIEAGRRFEKEIISWLAVRVASHKKLRGGVRFIDEIPKSPSGKILRRILKTQAVKEAESEKRAKL